MLKTSVIRLFTENQTKNPETPPFNSLKRQHFLFKRASIRDLTCCFPS